MLSKTAYFQRVETEIFTIFQVKNQQKFLNNLLTF